MASTEGVRQFGARRPGLTYVDRPCAYGIALDGDGRIALVHVTTDDGAWHDLPGGAIDPGETEQQAVVREFGEETGLKAAAGGCFARADQFMIKTDGQSVNNRSGFYEMAVEGVVPSLKVEDDHALQWVLPTEALLMLRHDSHAWAVTAWLRERAKAA